MDTNWKNDPRLKAMSKEKLNLLTEFAERIEHTNKNNLMEAFMSINMEARQKGIQFNDKETALLVTILSSGMAPAEKKKLDMLKMMSKTGRTALTQRPLPSKTCTIPKSSETFHIFCNHNPCLSGCRLHQFLCPGFRQTDTACGTIVR